MEAPPRTTLVFMTLAPMSMRATASSETLGWLSSNWFWMAKASRSTTSASSPACSTTATYSRILTFFTATRTTDMELADAITLEAEHHIPFAVVDVFLDYQVVDGEGDVVLGLEGDGVRQLLRGHLGQRHSLHDRLTSGDGDHGRRALDARFLHALLHRVAHERGFLDRALADYIVREWNLSECGQPPGATFALLQLDDFDRAGPDVESEGRRLLSQSEPLHAGSPIYELTCSSVKSTDASTTL